MNESIRFYILVGDEKTWKSALTKNLWGFSENNKGLWNNTNVDEYVALYVTKPIQKVIGFGRINRKFIEETIFWPDEKIFKRPIWKYRLEYSLYHISENWNEGIPVSSEIMLNQGRKVVNKDTFSSLVKAMDKKMKTKIHKEIFGKV